MKDHYFTFLDIIECNSKSSLHNYKSKNLFLAKKHIRQKLMEFPVLKKKRSMYRLSQ
jgi:hypothetical protein